MRRSERFGRRQVQNTMQDYDKVRRYMSDQYRAGGSASHLKGRYDALKVLTGTIEKSRFYHGELRVLVT